MASLKKISASCSMLVVCASAQAELTGYSFVDDISLTGKVRTVNYNVENIYRRDHPKPDEPRYRAGAWTAGLQVNLKTGYLADFLALGGSFYGAAKVDMDESKMKDSYQLLNDKNEGYSKAGQLYADLKYGDKKKDPISGNFKIGRQLLYTGLISSSGSRSVPSTWQGYNLSTKIYGADFKLAYVDKMSLRNEAEFNRLTNFDKQQIDFIIGSEIGYSFPMTDSQTLKLKYRNAFAKDFLQGHNGDIRWQVKFVNDMNLTLGGKYYHTSKNGDLWTGDAWYSPAFDDSASAYNFNATLDYHGWLLEGAVSHIDAKYTHRNCSVNCKPGKYYYDYGRNTHGIWDFPTSGFAEDFIYDGETVWMAGVGADLSSLGAKGVKLGYRFHYGSGIKVIDGQGKNKDASEHEHDLYLNFAPEGVFKGLVFKLEYGMYRNDEALRKAISKEENDLRVWLDYNFVLL